MRWLTNLFLQGAARARLRACVRACVRARVRQEFRVAGPPPAAAGRWFGGGVRLGLAA